MEVAVRGGFVLPPDVVRDGTFITTRKGRDEDGAMFSLLREARLSGCYVSMRITDAPGVQAYPGRCSLHSVTLR